MSDGGVDLWMDVKALQPLVDHLHTLYRIQIDDLTPALKRAIQDWRTNPTEANFNAAKESLERVKECNRAIYDQKDKIRMEIEQEMYLWYPYQYSVEWHFLSDNQDFFLKLERSRRSK